MQVDVYDIDRNKVGTFDLPEAVFAVEVKDALLWEQVKAQRASRRRGTHCTKTRGEARGGGAKPFRQKGTGRARQGSSRAPNLVGGGTAFGPKPRNYAYRLPRSARRAALRSVLSLRAKDEGIVVLDKIELTQAKTKSVQEILGRFDSRSALIVDVDNGNLRLSARNIPKSKYLTAEAINVYDVLDHDTLMLTKAAVDQVVARATKAKSAAETSAE